MKKETSSFYLRFFHSFCVRVRVPSDSIFDIFSCFSAYLELFHLIYWPLLSSMSCFAIVSVFHVSCFHHVLTSCISLLCFSVPAHEDWDLRLVRGREQDLGGCRPVVQHHLPYALHHFLCVYRSKLARGRRQLHDTPATPLPHCHGGRHQTLQMVTDLLRLRHRRRWVIKYNTQVVTWRLKGCIFHLVKWHIQPFNPISPHDALKHHITSLIQT